MRPSGTPQELEQHRRAVHPLSAGFSPVEVTRQSGFARRSVRRRKAAAHRGGAAAAKPAPGRPPRLQARECGLPLPTGAVPARKPPSRPPPSAGVLAAICNYRFSATEFRSLNGRKLDIPPGSRMKYAAGCTGSTLRPGVSCKLSWSLWALLRRPPCKFDNWRDWRPDAAAQVTARAASAVLRAVFSPKTRAASGRWIVRNFREPGAPVHRHRRARRGSSAHRAVQDRVHYPVAGTGRSCRTDSGSGRRAGHLAKISAGEDTAGGSVQT